MLYYDQQIDGARIAVWHVTEELDELLSLLPDADSVIGEAEKRFRSEGRILEWTTVRVLLFTILGRQVQISYDEQGAPYLPDYEGLNISISHTRGYVAIALSEHRMVGIDVEQVEHLAKPVGVDSQKETRVERVRERFVRHDEFAETIVGLLLHWSAKETVYKVLHRESVDLIDDLRISPFDENVYEGEFELEDLRARDVYKIRYKVFDDFVLTFTDKANS